MEDKNNKDYIPLVSIVITSYNRANFLEKAIESALTQDYPNLEIIVSDNCSTDNTDEVIKKYLHDPRLKYSVNETNIGMIPNFRKATNKLARGEYITYVSSDDYLVNNSFVSEAITRIQKFPNIVLVHSINIVDITKSNEFVTDGSYGYYKNKFYNKPYVIGREVFHCFPVCHSISFGGTLIDRHKLIEAGAFESGALSGDVQVILKLLLLGDVAFIDRNTYVARIHEGNATVTIVKAQTYIDNLAYIDVPYNFALENNLVDRTLLDKWRDGMYYNFCLQCMKFFYKRDKKEHKIMSEHIRINHPIVYKRIIYQLSWLFYCLVFANKTIGNLYTTCRSCLGKMKRSLQIRFYCF